MCEKSARPSRAWLGFENTEFEIVRRAWANGQSPGCRGTHLRSLNFVLIVPITDSSIFSDLWLIRGSSKVIRFFSFNCFFKASFCFLYHNIRRGIIFRATVYVLLNITNLNELIWALATDNCFNPSTISAGSSLSVSEAAADAMLNVRCSINSVVSS